jgi:hypothetical protein
MSSNPPEKNPSGSINRVIGGLLVVGLFATTAQWIAGNGSPDVIWGKIFYQLVVAFISKQECVNNNSSLGPEVAELLCACRKQAVPRSIAQAKTKQQLDRAISLGVSYCEPIAKSYVQVFGAGNASVPPTGIQSYPGLLSAGSTDQYSNLLYQMVIRQTAESGVTLRSMLSGNPYGSSTFNSHGFGLNSLYSSGYSGLISDQGRNYRVRVTGPETFSVSECRSPDCAF